MDKKVQSIKQLLEAVAVSYTNQDRYNKYLKLIETKYPIVGKFSSEINVADQVEAIVFGRTSIKGHEGEYLYLITDYTKSNRDKAGFITHFGFYDARHDKITKVENGYEFSNGARLLELPSDFVKFEHILALILNLGKFDMRKLKGNELLSAGKKSSKYEITNIDEKFELVTYTIRMVFTKNINGLIITGSPGIGKTYSLLQIIKDLNLKEDEDYYYVQGAKITLVQFFKTMYLNQDKIIIFDDSDSVIQNSDGINMLKAALDSNPRRVITYKSAAIIKEGIPTDFSFTGKCIFISNLPIENIDSALKSRSLVMDLHMTREEKFNRIKSLAQKVMPDVILGGTPESNREQREGIIDFLEEFMAENPDRPKNLDIRTLNKLIEIRNSVDDENLFKKLAANQLLMG